jgi:hypothetical protein
MVVPRVNLDRAQKDPVKAALLREKHPNMQK